MQFGCWMDPSLAISSDMWRLLLPLALFPLPNNVYSLIVNQCFLGEGIKKLWYFKSWTYIHILQINLHLCVHKKRYYVGTFNYTVVRFTKHICFVNIFTEGKAESFWKSTKQRKLTNQKERYSCFVGKGSRKKSSSLNGRAINPAIKRGGDKGPGH